MSLRRLGHRRLASGVFLHFDHRYLIDGNRAAARDVVLHPGGVGVLPIEGEQIWLVSQYRTAVEVDLLEIPAGKLDPSDRDPLIAGKRELAEEVGATAGSWTFLTSFYPSPGFTNEILHVYAATDLTFGERKPEGAEETHSTVVSCRLDEALDRIESGEIVDSKTQIALLLWDRKRRER